MHPRAILLVRARRSSRGSVRVRAAERALLPRERGHPARGRAPGAPGNLSLRAPARDARQDAVGPCWQDWIRLGSAGFCSLSHSTR